MNKTISMIIRIIVLILGLALSGFIVWQLLTGVGMLNLNMQLEGPVIIVVFGLFLLVTFGSAVSFFTNKHMVSTIFLAALVVIMALFLWFRYPAQADIYRWYFIYGLAVGLLTPLLKSKN